MSINTSRLVASNGVFGYEPKVTYLFGIPQTISEGGIYLDIPINSVAQSLDGNQTKTIQHIIQVGTMSSALEHQTPEQMFNTDPTNPVQAISAVKALQLANTQGQKIYQINQTNIDTTLPKLNLSSDIINDIKIAISQGKEVTTHTDNVSVPGWSGAGYIIIDPKTGDGAYLVSGGANGAFLKIKEGFEQIIFALTNNSIPSHIQAVIADAIGKILDFIDLVGAYQKNGVCGFIIQVILISFIMLLTYLYIKLLLIRNIFAIVAIDISLGALFEKHMLNRGHPCE